MFKTIIVHVDDSPQLETRLRAAACLAQDFGAHLVGSAATGMSWPAFVMLAGSLQVAPHEQYECMRAQARAGLRHFSERARSLGVQSVEELLIEDELRVGILLQSRYADLVVTSQDRGDTAPVRGMPEYLALHGPRPVLVVPPSYAGQAFAGNVVAGWDGSVQAVRAIGAAMPILQRARTVRLALVNPEREFGTQDEEPGAAMARYLARQGVHVELVNERTQAAPGDALLGIARAAGAGLLVTGAFGHSRYREIVLGGVTRVLLERAPVPVLFTH